MYKPVPKSGRSHYGSNFFEAFSPKLNRDVNFYSNLEFDHWVLVETDPNIVDFCEQPLLDVRGEYEGKEGSSIFDMWIKWKDGREEFLEIKYHADVQPGSKNYQKNLRQITIQRDWCNKTSNTHRLLTEKNIRCNKILLDNKKIILPYLRNINKIGDTNRFRILMELKQGCRSLEELCLKLVDMPTTNVKKIVYILIYEGRLNSNINEKPLGLETEVWING
jgi:hypothetical protein